MKNSKQRYTHEQIVELQSRALELYEADNSRAWELGHALLAVRTALPHGAFKPWWRANGLSQNRVSYCMRLADGKVKAAKAKQRTRERILISRIKKDVDNFLKRCANIKHTPTVDQIEVSICGLYLRLIGGISGIRQWPIDLDDPHVLAAEKEFKQALTKLLDAAFKPVAMGGPGWNREASPAPLPPDEAEAALAELFADRARHHRQGALWLKKLADDKIPPLLELIHEQR